MKTWELKVKVSVADNWAQDGFDGSQIAKTLKESCEGMLPFAYPHEFKIDIEMTEQPTEEELKSLTDEA